MRRRRAGGGDLNSPEKEECLTLPTVGSARDSQRGLLATSPSRPVVPGPASGDPRRPRRCAPLRPPSLWHRSRPDRHFEQYGRKKKKKKKERQKERKKKVVRVNATNHSQFFLASCKGGQGRLQ